MLKYVYLSAGTFLEIDEDRVEGILQTNVHIKGGNFNFWYFDFRADKV